MLHLFEPKSLERQHLGCVILLYKRNSSRKTAFETSQKVDRHKFVEIRKDIDASNNHFTTTAERLLNKSPKHKDEIMETVKAFNFSEESFHFHEVKYSEVVDVLRLLRNDCSTGDDEIPIWLIKPVVEHLASPLTHIINCCIEKQHFPKQWKIGRVVPIPKVDQPMSYNDFRPITILPALSKVFEKLLCKQLLKYIDNESIYSNTLSGFRKNHSTVTLLLKLKDDIVKAMNKSEITLAVMADFSKAFDTINYDTIIRKTSSNRIIETCHINAVKLSFCSRTIYTSK